MKKVLYICAIALAALTACNKEDSPAGGGSLADLIGTWYIDANPSLDIITFSENGKFTNEGEYYKNEGSYEFKDGKVTTTTEKTWSRETPQSSWVEDKTVGELPPDVFEPFFLYNKSVMASKETGDEKRGGEIAKVYFRKGASGPSDSNLVQGKWIYYLSEAKNTGSTVAKYDGNKFDLYILTWHEWLSGTFTYKDGMITYKVENFKIRDISSPLAEDISFVEEDLSIYDQHWRVPTVDKEGHYDYRMEPSFGYNFSMPFVTNGNEAYGSFAGLMPVYHKK